MLAHQLNKIHYMIPNISNAQIDRMYPAIIAKASAAAKHQFDQHKPLIEKYGFLIFGTHSKKEKKFITGFPPTIE
jgi:hypothetical protein